MKKKFNKLIRDERGINTVEVVVLVAIAIGLAIIFRDQITSFIQAIGDNVFDPTNFTITPTP